MNNKTIGALFLAVFLRTIGSEYLQNRLEVSTPFTSNTKLQECIYLWNKGLDMYNGDVCTQPPLLILMFSFIPVWLLPIIFIGLDLMIALMLYRLADYKKSLSHKVSTKEEEEDETAPKLSSLDPEWVSWAYLLNPYSIMACSGRSLGVLCNVFVLISIYMAIHRNLRGSMCFLSVASYLGMYPILLLPATLMHASSTKRDMVKGIAIFSLFSLGLVLLSTAQVDSWTWLNSTYQVQFLVSDLSPNIGLWWYFFIQVFNTFRLFFVFLFQFLVVIFVMPISLKFRNDYLFTVYILCSILAIFKSYPSLSDTSLSLALLSLFPDAMNYATSSFLLTNALLYASFLGPLFFHLWIYASSGNANFFYAITLVWGYTQMTLLLEVVGGYIRREWDRKYPGLRKARVEVFLN